MQYHSSRVKLFYSINKIKNICNLSNPDVLILFFLCFCRILFFYISKSGLPGLKMLTKLCFWDSCESTIRCYLLESNRAKWACITVTATLHMNVAVVFNLKSLWSKDTNIIMKKNIQSNSLAHSCFFSHVQNFYFLVSCLASM